MIRLATVGTSAITDKFLAACSLTGEYELAAVYSRDYERGRAFGAQHGCDAVFTSLEKMAEYDGVDAVYIASPNVFHAPQSRVFLEHGKHVICEKPIAVSPAEYLETKALADRKGLIYTEAIITRHASQRAAVKYALGKIGKIAAARIDYCQLTSRYEKLMRGEQVNIFDMSLAAGTLMDLGVYCVYAAVDLLGVPDKIPFASASFLENGADSGGCAVFSYRDFSAALTYSKVGQSASGSEIIGSEGTLKIAMVSQYAGVTLVKDGRETEIAGFPDRAVLMSGEADKFAAYINNSGDSREDYQSASRLCMSVHECMESIRDKAGIVFTKSDRK